MKKTVSALIAAVMAASIAMPTSVLAEGTVSGSDTFGSGSDTTTGSVTVTYDTSAGTWTDPSGGTHNASTYIVIIPTSVSWTGMSIGKVSASASYNVQVCGVVDKPITVTATPDTALKDSAADTITMSVSQGKTTWTADDAYGTLTDGKVGGTTAQDTVTLSGTAKHMGAYSGKIAYSASLATE